MIALIAVRFLALFDSLVNFVYCGKPKIAMIIKKALQPKFNNSETVSLIHEYTIANLRQIGIIKEVTKEWNAMAKSDSKTVNPEKSSQASDKKLMKVLKALGSAIDQITKQFGDGSIMKLGEAHKVDVLK